MTENRIALGIVGASASYGWGMRAHLPAFLALPEYDLAAVCTTRQETAEESAKAYGARKSYWDFREMVADPEIDVVDVCVRAPSHYEVAMAALEAGKHVFCEWPLGANSAQADEMASLAEAKGVRTMVGLQSRYAPSFQRFRQLVQEGYLGRLISANMTMFLPGLGRPRPEGAVWSTQREAGAHTLSIATGHALDVFLWCMGELSEVSAEVTTRMPQLPVADTDRFVDVTSPDNVSLFGRTSRRRSRLRARRQRAMARHGLPHGGVWHGGDAGCIVQPDGGDGGPGAAWRKGERPGDADSEPAGRVALGAAGGAGRRCGEYGADVPALCGGYPRRGCRCSPGLPGGGTSTPHAGCPAARDGDGRTGGSRVIAAFGVAWLLIRSDIIVTQNR